MPTRGRDEARSRRVPRRGGVPRRPEIRQGVPGRGSWRPRAGTWAALLGLLVAVMLVHARSAGYGFSHLDDDHLIVDRWARLRDVSSLGTAFHEPYFPRLGPNEGYYRPLVTASLVLDALGSERPDPAPFHRTNVALHAVVCALLLFLLRRLGVGEWLSFGLALLFAVHPAFTMVVTWIPGRNDLLLALFLFGAWLAWAPRMPAWRLALHLVLFLAALLTKEAAVVLPALLVAQVWLLEGRKPDPRRDVRLWIGWAVVLAVWIAMRSQVAMGGEGISIAQRLSYVRDRLPGLLIGLGKIVLPLDLAPLANQGDSTLLWGWISLALVVLVMVLTRGAARRLAALGLAIFLAFLLPTLPVSNTLLLENRLYLPALGVLLVAAVALARVPRSAAAALLAATGVVFGVAAVRYGEDLRTPAAFADALLRTSPDMALAHSVAGDIWRESGDFARSEAAYHRSLEIESGQWLIHNNLGVFAMRRGDLALAEREFRTELARNPRSEVAHDNLAVTLLRMRRMDEAAAEWAQAVRLDPALREHPARIEREYRSRGFTAQADSLRRALAAHGVDTSP